MRCDAMSYIFTLKIIRIYLSSQTASRSTVSCTQTSKRIGAVPAILQATDVHALLAHVGFTEWARYRRRACGCLHAHDVEARLLLQLLLLRLELLLLWLWLELLLLLLLLLEWLLQVKVCLCGRGRRRGSHERVPGATGQHACGL